MTTAESCHPGPKAGRGAVAPLASGTADSDLGKRNPAVSGEAVQSPATVTGDTETAYDKHPRSTHQPQAMRELEMFVTILEDGISLKNKHALFKWIRRTLQLNDCLISETGVTAARTLLLITSCPQHSDYS